MDAQLGHVIKIHMKNLKTPSQITQNAHNDLAHRKTREKKWFLIIFVNNFILLMDFHD